MELKLIIDLCRIKENQINEQIEIRKKLINEMVGSLYPRILRAEIEKLKKMKKEFIEESEMII